MIQALSQAADIHKMSAAFDFAQITTIKRPPAVVE
jgi:hypothetical protein